MPCDFLTSVDTGECSDSLRTAPVDSTCKLTGLHRISLSLPWPTNASSLKEPDSSQGVLEDEAVGEDASKVGTLDAAVGAGPEGGAGAVDADGVLPGILRRHRHPALAAVHLCCAAKREPTLPPSPVYTSRRISAGSSD